VAVAGVMREIRMQSRAFDRAKGFLRRASYAARAARAILRDPYEGFERTRERIVERATVRGGRGTYQVQADWHEALHDQLGLSWPCDVQAEFEVLWSQVSGAMTQRQRALGKGTFGGWDDGDPALVRAIHCLSRHLRPRTAVETGVAHGVSSRFILEALERNGAGGLWSIDLAPLLDTQLQDEIGMAVPAERRDRWTYVSGSSRRRLPGLLRKLGSVDLFVHDSMHTERNVRFELDHVWPVLSDSGAIVLDDVDFNRGLQSFSAANPEARTIVAAHDDGQRLFGIVLKGPVRVES
jgi:hypothetical protein